MGNFYQGVADAVAANRANAQNAAAAGNFLNSFMDSWKQKKLDDIANQLLAEQHAPKATAVLDDSGQPVIDPDATTDPATEAAANRALGYDYDTTPTVPDQGGIAGLKLSLAMERQRTLDAMHAARTARLTTPTVRPDYHTTDTPYGKMTPAQAAAADIRRQSVQQRDQTAQQRQQNWQTNQDRLRATYGTRGLDPTKEYNQWFQANAGIPVQAWGNWQNPHGVDADGKPVDNGDYFSAEVPDGQGSTKTITMPATVFNQGQAKYQEYLQKKAEADQLRTSRVTPAGPINDPDVSAAPPLPVAPDAAPPASTLGTASGPAAVIREKYRAGQITREQAKAQLAALGIN